MIYQKILKPLLFQLDPEDAHHLVLSGASLCSKSQILAKLIARFYGVDKAGSSVNVMGLSFPNCLGLAAGFDKNCEAFLFLEALGFGHIEIGTVTNKPQPGNEKPRLWRLPEDRALINRLGFPSEGVEAVIARLRKIPQNRRAVLGINIGKNKATELEHAVADYVTLFRSLKTYGDYFVLNISSPNTPELRKLQEPARLKELFQAIAAENDLRKPVLIKLAPDLALEDLRASVDAALSCSVSGLIVSNTTFDREGLLKPVEFQGGLSGVPLFKKALGCVRAAAEVCGGQVPIIGVGGISSARDVEQMREAGASLVQLYSAMVFEGPGLPARILRELRAGS